MKLPSSGKVEIGVELILEGESIYLVIGGDKDNKIDMTYDAFSLVGRSMSNAAQRLGGNCEVELPEGTLTFREYGKEGAE